MIGVLVVLLLLVVLLTVALLAAVFRETPAERHLARQLSDERARTTHLAAQLDDITSKLLETTRNGGPPPKPARGAQIVVNREPMRGDYNNTPTGMNAMSGVLDRHEPSDTNAQIERALDANKYTKSPGKMRSRQRAWADNEIRHGRSVDDVCNHLATWADVDREDDDALDDDEDYIEVGV